MFVHFSVGFPHEIGEESFLLHLDAAFLLHGLLLVVVDATDDAGTDEPVRSRRRRFVIQN